MMTMMYNLIMSLQYLPTIEIVWIKRYLLSWLSTLINHKYVCIIYYLTFNFFFLIILEKYPEIKKLYGPDKAFKWIVVIATVLQLASFYLIKDLKWPIVIILAYCFGGVVNHSLMLGKI